MYDSNLSLIFKNNTLPIKLIEIHNINYLILKKNSSKQGSITYIMLASIKGKKIKNKKHHSLQVTILDTFKRK